MKKNYLLFLTFMVSVLGMVGQTATNSPKLSAAYSANQIASMTPEELSWKNFIADKMCIIGETTPEKVAGFTTINVGTQTNATTETFNPFLLNIQPLEHDNQYFLIEGTTKTLFVYSKARLDVLYQRAVKNQK